MASKAPPIPPDQRPHPADRSHAHGPEPGRGDHVSDDPTSWRGDRGVNLKEQGRHGNRRQNVDTVHWKTQDR